VALCFTADIVRADSIPADGRILVGHGSDPAPPKKCGLDFTVPLSGSHGGIKNCINTSGVDWIGLEIFGFIPINNTINCITSPDPQAAAFNTCRPPDGFPSFVIKVEGNKEEVEIVLLGGEIKSGSLFFIDLDTPGCSSTNHSCGWLSSVAFGGNVKVEAIVAPTPEPGTLLLFAGGVGVLCMRRRRCSLA